MNLILIYDLIKDRTSDNPITRRELHDLSHIADRQIRNIIGDLRAQGFRIVSTSKGYYMAQTEDEYKAFRNVYLAKARSIHERVRAMDAYTKGQEVMRT